MIIANGVKTWPPVSLHVHMHEVDVDEIYNRTNKGTSMTARQVVEEWVRRFNLADIEGIAQLYAADAVNHQVVMEPLRGREAIREMFASEFGRAKMVCIVENLFESGDWAILEWRDPNGLRGCGFFHVKSDHIVFQRGYFDQLSFFRLQGIPIPKEYLESVKANSH